jgi:hypothetical protein
MNKHGKSVDKTFLSIDQAEDRGFIHRDYIAHCLRWSHVCKRLYERKSYESAIILDVGCGRELPMAKMLYSSRLIPRHYFGVDVGPIEDSEAAKIANGKFPHTLWEHQNFLELTKQDVFLHRVPLEEYDYPNIVTCFEVLEHVEPKMMIQMLHHMKSLTSEDARFFISTPCWNFTDCAANHVNEMTYDALGAVFEDNGFIVENTYGTFASIRDYEHLITGQGKFYGCEGLNRIFDRLREYYDTNFLSCIFAPLFPAQSRNCMWELRKGTEQRKFPTLAGCREPWGSSNLWKDMAWIPN